MFIIKHKKIFLAIAAVLVALSITAIAVWGLKPGIDFRGGASTEVAYPEGRPAIEDVRASLGELGIGETLVQPTGDTGYIIKSRDLTDDEHTALLSALSQDGERELEEKNFSSIGPSVGRELTRKAVISIILVALAIITFIAIAFRHVSRPVSSWKYGLIAVITLVHDIAIPAGVFAVLGRYMGVEVDTLFVVALLTILGLSVSDTIVVFDRIRENLHSRKQEGFAETVGRSLNQTFTRSINTSLTLILVLLALYFFGPVTTKHFALVLTIGMFFGTYSSLFVASPLLVAAEEMQRK